MSLLGVIVVMDCIPFVVMFNEYFLSLSFIIFVAFDTDGSLKALPQLDEGRTIDAAMGKNGAATSLPIHAAGDLLFVFLPTDITGESWP